MPNNSRPLIPTLGSLRALLVGSDQTEVIERGSTEVPRRVVAATRPFRSILWPKLSGQSLLHSVAASATRRRWRRLAAPPVQRPVAWLARMASRQLGLLFVAPDRSQRELYSTLTRSVQSWVADDGHGRVVADRLRRSEADGGERGSVSKDDRVAMVARTEAGHRRTVGGPDPREPDQREPEPPHLTGDR